MMRSSAYNCFGVLMGISWLASCPRWPSLRGTVLPMITLFPSQGDFCATASHALNTAIREYGWIDHNIVTTVSRPPLPPGRVRYLSDAERSRFLTECKNSQNRYLYALVILALYTGLRRGSLFALS